MAITSQSSRLSQWNMKDGRSQTCSYRPVFLSAGVESYSEPLPTPQTRAVSAPNLEVLPAPCPSASEEALVWQGWISDRLMCGGMDGWID